MGDGGQRSTAHENKCEHSISGVVVVAAARGSPPPEIKHKGPISGLVVKVKAPKTSANAQETVVAVDWTPF